ncbi:MAG: PLD nuclease N-terminal domain-containing protein [Actinomycetaceae bacterium]|nr:PLD nuclease N-terminal domain-containing protein [Actinomycetaceae bacterium]
MFRVLLVVLSFAVTVYALADCARTNKESLPGGIPKPLWMLIITLITPIGGIAWVVISRVNAAENHGGELPKGIWSADNPIHFSVGNAQSTPQRAPDDDPEFLFKLRKAAQLKRENSEGEAAVSSSAPGRPRPTEQTPSPQPDSQDRQHGENAQHDINGQRSTHKSDIRDQTTKEESAGEPHATGTHTEQHERLGDENPADTVNPHHGDSKDDDRTHKPTHNEDEAPR